MIRSSILIASTGMKGGMQGGMLGLAISLPITWGEYASVVDRTFYGSSHHSAECARDVLILESRTWRI